MNDDLIARTTALKLALEKAPNGTQFDEVLALAEMFYRFLIGQEDKTK